MDWKAQELLLPLLERAAGALEAMAHNPPEPDPLVESLIACARAARELAADRDVLAVTATITIRPIETNVSIAGLLTPGSRAELELAIERHSGRLQADAEARSEQIVGETREAD